MLRKLRPEIVVESGVWKGQGTWLIEQALPKAQLICFDVDFSNFIYKSEKAEYIQGDVKYYNWNKCNDREKILFFFDDHQNAFDRIIWAKHNGFKHFIFEDNYPSLQGDCYSLKKVFMQNGFNKYKERYDIKSRIKLLLAYLNIRADSGYINPNSKHSQFLIKILETYYEFPPVVKKSLTRWGDEWNENDYPTEKPIINDSSQAPLLFSNEAQYYTWICYAKIK